ncbi:class I SAM-dependent methyltransferase [Oceanibium sediminis]|uniref:class I SAM-dependent methyltransferase n=1 Tax=Oceanibium sediminis TaxID=2026339 RepID=UPI000DD30C5C|nr:class I SAM-dependent methyltransferase [Oceanibium sediminis]
MALATEAHEISDIAFGFMGSKALFAALEFGIFDKLADAPRTAEEIGQACGLHPERARTLLTALAGLELLSVTNQHFENAPAVSAFLVKGEKYDFSDYLRLQVGRQMYPLMSQLEPALKDELPEGATKSYAEWFADPEQARLYSDSQHAGSLGPAAALARRLDFSGVRRMLDVGGGTGAFSITFCNAVPDLQSTIIEFPNVVARGREKVAEAGLSDRIHYLAADATGLDWPEGQDAVLMSYLLSGVPAEAHADLFATAFRVLRPGGRLLIHDFIVEGDRSGPRLTALWQLQHTAFTPKAASLDAEGLASALGNAGFQDVGIAPMIPEMTMIAEARRPG